MAGTGLSDPIGYLPTLEERVADLEAVLDAAGSERAVLFGASEGGPTSVLLAAMRPQRIISLILYGTFAVWPTAAPEDFSPGTIERAELRELFEAVEHWGEADSLMKVFAPSVTMSETQKRSVGMFTRAAASLGCVTHVRGCAPKRHIPISAGDARVCSHPDTRRSPDADARWNKREAFALL
jgi:pimeloyl-ACP methyl ester carboxylesterase